MTRSAPSRRAASTAHRPTAPSPTTTTVEPGWTPADIPAWWPVALTALKVNRAGPHPGSGFSASPTGVPSGGGARAKPSAHSDLGDTPEIVETAMGRPNRKLERPAADGRETVWIYTRYREKRLEATGWSEVLVAGVQDQNGKVIQQPVTREVRREAMNRDMHVIFVNGRVRSVEYLTR